MATTTSLAFDVGMATSHTDSSVLLRTALRGNAAFSTVTGLAGLVAGGRIAEAAGISPSWLVPVGGAGLLVFAAGLVWLARRPVADLRAHTPGIVVADLGWVAATAAVVLGGRLADGWLTSTGVSGAVVIALVVAALAATQTVGFRRLPA